MTKLSIRDIDVADQEVLMRVDFNVPLNEANEITDDTRIQAALPSIQHLLKGRAKLVLTSHLGRPKGTPKAEFSLRPTAERLGELLKKPVQFVDDCVGEKALTARARLVAGDVLLLENTRFHSEEVANDDDFSRALACEAKLFVNDAFGTAHRAHASTEGVTHFVEKSAMGFLIEKELDYLVEKIDQVERPFLVILGGAKVSDKIEVITSLLDRADAILIGGAMAYTFLKAQGYKIGKSLVENDKLERALHILEQAKVKGVRLLLPVDTRVTQEFREGAETKTAYRNGDGIEDDWMGIDIGDQAIAEFCAEIAQAKTILWNGPMGVFEIDSFAKGTEEIARAVAESSAVSIVGGGDSVTAVKKFNLENQIDFISTGGGASLELLEGKELPGIVALNDR